VVLAEEPWHKQEAVVAETAETAASRLGGKPLVAPLAEAALGRPASAALLAEAEELLEPQGSHSRQAEQPAGPLAVALALGIIEKVQRCLCIRQGGEAGAAALAEPWVGARLAAQELPAAAAAGTTT
jgi:hypothetical protein